MRETCQLLALPLDGNPDTRGRTVPATTLAAALGQLGHTVSATAVKDHCGRRCVCDALRSPNPGDGAR